MPRYFKRLQTAFGSPYCHGLRGLIYFADNAPLTRMAHIFWIKHA